MAATSASMLLTLDNAFQGVERNGIHAVRQVQAQNEHARQLADPLYGVQGSD